MSNDIGGAHLSREFQLIRELVVRILETARAHVWTVQGFGMVRTKLRDAARLHVWNPALAVPDVSVIHDHPWPLHSTIIAGWIKNCKYVELSQDIAMPNYHRQDIATGEGGGYIDGTVRAVHLSMQSSVDYFRGSQYGQDPAEVHSSHPQPGTVTLMQRPMGPPLQKARVYWPIGKAWVSAEPRPATAEEVDSTATLGLDMIRRDMAYEARACGK